MAGQQGDFPCAEADRAAGPAGTGAPQHCASVAGASWLTGFHSPF